MTDPPVEGWEDKLDVHYFELTETVSSKFGTDTAFLVVLRPDNYIGLISDEISPEIVNRYLSRFN
jgi:hypothetical protein